MLLLSADSSSGSSQRWVWFVVIGSAAPSWLAKRSNSRPSRTRIALLLLAMTSWHRKERQPSDHRHLLMQRAREQVLWDHRMDAAHDVDNLGHPETYRDAAQCIGIKRRQFGMRREERD